MDKQLVNSAKPAATNQNLSIHEAELLASTVITDKDSALAEAIHMLTEIANGRSYGTFEYMTKLMQMRKVYTPTEITLVEHGAPICDSCGLPHNTQLDCSEVSNEEKEKVLERAREAQTTFWHSLGELEAVIGNDVDGSQDLNDTDVKTLASDDTDSSDPIGRMYSNAFKGETDNERAKS